MPIFRIYQLMNKPLGSVIEGSLTGGLEVRLHPDIQTVFTVHLRALKKTWWRPEAMWFAETDSPSLTASAVGTVTLARRGDTPEARPAVHWLAVLPSWRRRGVGRLLITSLEAAVWETGQRQVWLETHAQWGEAAQLYESLGYGPA